VTEVVALAKTIPLLAKQGEKEAKVAVFPFSEKKKSRGQVCWERLTANQQAVKSPFRGD